MHRLHLAHLLCTNFWYFSLRPILTSKVNRCIKLTNTNNIKIIAQNKLCSVQVEFSRPCHIGREIGGVDGEVAGAVSSPQELLPLKMSNVSQPIPTLTHWTFQQLQQTVSSLTPFKLYHCKTWWTWFLNWSSTNI